MADETGKVKTGRVKKTNVILIMLVVTAGFIALSCQSGGTDPGADDQYVQKITSVEQFNEVVLKSDKPVLVDFFATWCGPCKRLAPTIHELAKEYEGRAVFVKVDTDKVMELAAKYKVSYLPDVRIFNDGKEIKKLIGLQSADKYSSILDSALADKTGKEK